MLRLLYCDHELCSWNGKCQHQVGVSIVPYCNCKTRRNLWYAWSEGSGMFVIRTMHVNYDKYCWQADLMNIPINTYISKEHVMWSCSSVNNKFWSHLLATVRQAPATNHLPYTQDEYPTSFSCWSRDDSGHHPGGDSGWDNFGYHEVAKTQDCVCYYSTTATYFKHDP